MASVNIMLHYSYEAPLALKQHEKVYNVQCVHSCFCDPLKRRFFLLCIIPHTRFHMYPIFIIQFYIKHCSVLSYYFHTLSMIDI